MVKWRKGGTLGKKFSFERWVDELRLAFVGLRKVALRKEFLVPAVVSFLVFGLVLNLLAAGTASVGLLFRVDWGAKMQILADAFLKIFGVGQTAFLDWIFTFLIAVLQGVLIGLVVFVICARRRAEREKRKRSGESADLQNVGIVAGLAILGSGCPTCGTTILMPVIISIAGSSSMALASALSWVLTAASVVVALLAFKKLGFETYAIVMDEKFRRKTDNS